MTWGRMLTGVGIGFGSVAVLIGSVRHDGTFTVGLVILAVAGVAEVIRDILAIKRHRQLRHG